MSQSFGVIAYDVPNLGLVTVSLDPASWPRESRALAYVPRWTIVPDPEQARDADDFDEESLKSLGDNIKTNGQAEVMKVRLLTLEEQQKFALTDGRLPVYMIVSGERRWRSTAPEMADVPILEVRVAHYKNAADQFLDGFIINEDRQNYGPMSLARSLARILREKCDGNVSELCRVTRKNRTTVDMYLRFNEMAPEVFPYLSLKRAEQDRMGLGVASIPSKLSHMQQRKYLGPLMVTKEAGETVTQQIRWLTEKLAETGHGSGAGSGPRPGRPMEYRARFLRLIENTRTAAVVIMGASTANFTLGFKDMDAEEALKSLQTYDAMLEWLMKVRERFVGVLTTKQSFGERNQALLPGWRMAEFREKPSAPFEKRLVSATRYQELLNIGAHRWQIEGLPDPDLQANGSARAEPAPSKNGTTSTIVIPFFERGRGRNELLKEGVPLDPATYTQLRREGRLFWQRQKLGPSEAETAFCIKHNLFTETLGPVAE